MPSSFIDQLPVFRGDPLGPGTLNRLGDNTRFLDEAARVEHRVSGVHNALEIPFLVGKVAYPNTYLFDSTWFDSVSNASTGRYDVKAKTTVDVMSGTSCLVNVSDGDTLNKPYMAAWAPGGGADTHSTPIGIYKMTGPLGTRASSGGNAWALTNATFDFALHAYPPPQDASELGPVHSFVRREYVTDATDGWNQIITNQELHRKTLFQEHLSNGEHSTPRVAKGMAYARAIAGPDYELAFAKGIDAISYISTGTVVVNVGSITSGSPNTFVAFVEPVPAYPGELVVANCVAVTPFSGVAAWGIFIYAYNPSNEIGTGGWWRADRDFFVSVYTP